MKQTLTTRHLNFKTRRLRRSYSEQLCYDNKLVQGLAHPLFEAGISIAAITERAVYDSNPTTEGRIYHSLRLLLQGEMRVEMGGRDFDFKPGELLVCPAGVPMRCYTVGSRTWWLYFEIDDLPAWEPLKRHRGYVRPFESAVPMFLLLRETLDAALTHDALTMRRARSNCRALVDRLRLEMLRGGQERSPHTAGLHELVEAVAAAPGHDWTRKTMAARLHVSVSQLTRLFRKELGLSPHELVMRQRMKHAVDRLVNTDQTVAAIAAESGYNSLHSFTRLFTKHVGQPPGRYRTSFGHSRTMEAVRGKSFGETKRGRRRDSPK